MRKSDAQQELSVMGAQIFGYENRNLLNEIN
jgi:hypothetical protein